MKHVLLALVLALAVGRAATTKEALAAWGDPRRTYPEKLEAACAVVTNGMPIATVIALLGTNYAVLRPFSAVSLDLTDPGRPRRGAPPGTCSLLYRFDQGTVFIATTAGISADPRTGVATGVSGGSMATPHSR